MQANAAKKRRMKTQQSFISTTKSRVAEANASVEAIRPIGCIGVWKSMILNEWLALAQLVPQPDFKERCADFLMNTGIVSALFLTMVHISGHEEVGDELEKWTHELAVQTNGTVILTVDHANYVYTMISMVSQLCLIIATMHCLMLYLIVNQTSNFHEAVHWRNSLGQFLYLPFWLLIGGLACFVVSQIWLGLTILPFSLWLSMLITALVMVSIIIGFEHHAIGSLYKAKYAISQGTTFEAFAEDTSIFTQQGQPAPAAAPDTKVTHQTC